MSNKLSFVIQHFVCVYVYPHTERCKKAITHLHAQLLRNMNLFIYACSWYRYRYTCVYLISTSHKFQTSSNFFIYAFVMYRNTLCDFTIQRASLQYSTIRQSLKIICMYVRIITSTARHCFKKSIIINSFVNI